MRGLSVVRVFHGVTWSGILSVMEVHVPRGWDPSRYPLALKARPRDRAAIESKYAWVVAGLLRREWAGNESGDTGGWLSTSYRLLEDYVGSRYLRAVLDDLIQVTPEGCPGPVLEAGAREGARGNLYKYRDGECALYRVARWAWGGDMKPFPLVDSYGRKYRDFIEREYRAMVHTAPHLERTREVIAGCQVLDGWQASVEAMRVDYYGRIQSTRDQSERNRLSEELNHRIHRREFSVEEVNTVRGGAFMFKRGTLGNRLFHPLVYLPRDLRPFLHVEGWGNLAYVDLRNSQPLMLAAVIRAAMGGRSDLHDFAPFQALDIPHPSRMRLAGLWDVASDTGAEQVDVDACREALRASRVEYCGVTIPDDGDGLWKVGGVWHHVTGAAYDLDGSTFVPIESEYPGPLELLEAAVGPGAFAEFLHRSGGVRVPEEWDYIQTAEAGRFYEVLSDEVAKATGEAVDRSTAKLRFMDSVAFHDHRKRTVETIQDRSPSGVRINYRNEWERAFHRRFPEAFAVVRFIKARRGHTELVRLLQQVEAFVFVDLILSELDGEAIPIHDGFIIPQDRVAHVLEVSGLRIREALGVSPEFAVEMLGGRVRETYSPTVVA